MSRNLFAVFLLVVLITLSMSGVAQAPPSADAYVTDTQPTENFGNSTLLPVQSGTTSYIKLNLGTVPANSTIAKATLRLYVNAVASPGAFDVFQVEGSWTERDLRFSNAPQVGSSATGEHPTSVNRASLHQFVLVDITQLVQRWLAGSAPNYGVALALTGVRGSFSFDSKESAGAAHQPELEVVIAGTNVPSPASVPVLAAPPNGGQVFPQQGADPYVDNGTALQTGANFNIDGTGTAGILNAVSQYELNGNPVIGISGYLSQSLGYQAGFSNTGNLNTFAGVYAGSGNTSGAFNTVVGAQANAANATGNYNTIVGAWAGLSNTGTNNAFYGAYAGYGNTSGVNNMFFGTNAGHSNTTGNGNFFLGAGSGYNNTTGNNNTFLGYLSGQNADATASNNLYVGSQGAAGESSTVRIGDPTNQTAAFIAGIAGASTDSGAPVFVDSTGKLGTGGGAVSFAQVTGTLSSPQFTGTYSNSVALSNPTNVIDGNFTGNGSGLTGVSSGLSWPIVLRSADYTIQANDFSTPTSYGNYLILTGSGAHTFTLPNPAPSNGECVAIDNNAGAPINSNTNVFLTVSANGLTIDGGSPNATQPKRNSYLYCSDGTNYWRLDRQLAGPSQIGPVLYTVDTGPVNALQTTFVAGLDFGLNTGTAIFILPTHANTIFDPTLNVNGLGAKKILKYGNQGLAPGDLSTTALAVLIYDGQFWELVNPQTAIGTVTSVGATAPLVSTGGSAPVVSCPTCVTAPTLTGTTGSIGGTALTAGSCTTGTAAVIGAVVGHPVSVSASDGSLPNGLIILSAAVTSSSTVAVQLCATANVTPMANTYNVSTQ